MAQAKTKKKATSAKKKITNKKVPEKSTPKVSKKESTAIKGKLAQKGFKAQPFTVGRSVIEQKADFDKPLGRETPVLTYEEIKTKRVFESFIPPMTELEYDELKANIRESGRVREPLVLWKDVIVDGHHRWKIIQELKDKEGFDVEYTTEQVEFGNEYDARIWMLYNALGKRNLNTYGRCELVLELEGPYKELAKKKMSSIYRERHPELFTDDSQETSEMLAQIAGVKKRTLERAQRVSRFLKSKRADITKEEQQELRSKLALGLLSIAGADKVVAKKDKDTSQKLGNAFYERYSKAYPEYKLHKSKFQDCYGRGVKDGIKKGSVAAVISDVLYDRDWEKFYPDLFDFCNHVLCPEGKILIMCGQQNLPSLYKVFSQAPFVHNWVLCWTTQKHQWYRCKVKPINAHWKPIVFFSKDKEYVPEGDDVAYSDLVIAGPTPPGKEFDENLQDEETFIQLIERFTKPGDIVCDPCMGQGTTGQAAMHTGRKFIGIELNEGPYGNALVKVKTAYDKSKDKFK